MSSGAFPDRPPKPRLTLRVGMTGKRALAGTDTARLRTDVERVFEALGAFLLELQSKHHNVLSDKLPILRIVCGMAEGADQLAVEIAQARSQKTPDTAKQEVEIEVAAILPFKQEEFEKDFHFDPNRPKGEQVRTEAEAENIVQKFRGLLTASVVKSVLEIDDEAILDPARPYDRNLAYPALRDVLLEHSDIVVALSDDIDGGPGGTVDVIRIAVGEGIPVIKISTVKPRLFLMRAAEPDAPIRDPVEDEELEPLDGPPKTAVLPSRLCVVLNRILEPPDYREPAAAELRDETAPGRKRLDWFFQERFRSPYLSRIFKASRAALTVEADPHERLCWKAFAAFRKRWGNYSVDRPEDIAGKMWPPNHNEFTKDDGRAIRDILAARFGWADALAIRYADATRSSYFAIAFLGALAVLVGLLALLGPERYGSEIKMAALLTEGIILAFAGFRFFRPAHHARWHQRMIEYRAIAELLRHQRYLHVLGASDRVERTADRTWREPDAWVGWYVRTTLHELGIPSARLSAEHRRKVIAAYREAELEGKNGQIGYNLSLAKDFSTIDRRLNKMVQIAFWVTIATAITGFLLLGALVLFERYQWKGHAQAYAVLHAIKPYFTVIMAFVPALIAAVHGVRFQMEFRNTAERAAATGRELSELTERLEKALKSNAYPGRKFSVSYVRLGNEAMSSDLAGWSNVYRGKAPEPP